MSNMILLLVPANSDPFMMPAPLADALDSLNAIRMAGYARADDEGNKIKDARDFINYSAQGKKLDAYVVDDVSVEDIDELFNNASPVWNVLAMTSAHGKTPATYRETGVTIDVPAVPDEEITVAEKWEDQIQYVMQDIVPEEIDGTGLPFQTEDGEDIYTQFGKLTKNGTGLPKQEQVEVTVSVKVNDEYTYTKKGRDAYSYQETEIDEPEVIHHGRAGNKTEILKYLPDVVTVDADGNEVSRGRPTEVMLPKMAGMNDWVVLLAS